MCLQEDVASLPPDLQQKVLAFQHDHGEELAINYALALSSPDLNTPRRGLPRQHQRRKAGIRLQD